MCKSRSTNTPPPQAAVSESREERRKEKARDAARERRSKESECFQELERLLCLPHHCSMSADRLSLIRLTVAQLKCRAVVKSDNFQKTSTRCEAADRPEDLGLLDCLNGFCLVVGSNLEVIFVSKNIQSVCGLSPEEVMGHGLADFVHPCDQAVLSCLTPQDVIGGERRSVDATARIKCTITEHGRVTNIKQADYKPLRLVGTARRIYPSDESSFAGPVFIGTVSPVGPNLTSPPQTGVFSTNHFADMRFATATSWMSEVARYPAEEVPGLSFFNLIHSLDLPHVEAGFKNLRGHGQCWTPPYRLLVRGGGFCWLQTKAVCKPASGRENRSHSADYTGTQCIECQHSQLSCIEDEGEVLALIQLGPHHLQPSTLDAGIVGPRKERSRGVHISKRRHETRLLQVMPGTKPQTEEGLAAKNMRQSYSECSPAKAGTRGDRPSATFHLPEPANTTSVIWSSKKGVPPRPIGVKSVLPNPNCSINPQFTEPEPSLSWSRFAGQQGEGERSKAGGMNETQGRWRDQNIAEFVTFNTPSENDMQWPLPQHSDVHLTLGSRSMNPATATQTSSSPSNKREAASIPKDSVFAAPSFLELETMWSTPDCSLNEENFPTASPEPVGAPPPPPP